MRRSDIVLVLGALTSGGLSCASRAPAQATEVPAGPPRDGGETSCRHELGRCGGHKPGDGACGGRGAAEANAPSSTPIEDIVVEPGKFVEINLEMAAGAVTEVTFAAVGGPVAWNVHSHDGDKVAIHAEGDAAAGTLRFAAPSAGLYSYLWQNSGQVPVRLTARLQAQGAVRVRSIHPAP